ncbi:hypothetical protein M407DRAFT_17651 [Tulasnella calospora MUT 4182]|uniref:Uncharacterized protein n=1 Tax=Tulasnella calospora MUT 4182 TaxID=1051891 RepID=A0A0C3QWS8_9AGAM|nr:hypothetical protein M407DRAFT_17651 [Tulasnella calospora MUT 4182]
MSTRETISRTLFHSYCPVHKTLEKRALVTPNAVQTTSTTSIAPNKSNNVAAAGKDATCFDIPTST